MLRLVYVWFLGIDLSMICVYVYVSVCLDLPPRLVIISGMIWTSYDWLNKLYSFYMVAVVSIISTVDVAL